MAKDKPKPSGPKPSRKNPLRNTPPSVPPYRNPNKPENPKPIPGEKN